MIMSLLEDVKKALRVSSATYDDEVMDLINAGKSDLRLAGIYFEDETEELPLDPLVKRAVVTYCKSNFGYENTDADRFRDSYVMLKQHLSLAGDYREPLE